jgi:hypothetical protein
MYFEKVKTTKVYVRDCTMVTPYPLLLFGGQIVVKHELMQVRPKYQIVPCLMPAA